MNIFGSNILSSSLDSMLTLRMTTSTSPPGTYSFFFNVKKIFISGFRTEHRIMIQEGVVPKGLICSIDFVQLSLYRDVKILHGEIV